MRKYRRYKETVAIARQIAEEVAARGGPDLRHLSDEELVELLTESMAALARTIRYLTVTTDQAAEAMRQLGKALTEADPGVYSSDQLQSQS